jgi:hypothetical protein
MGKSGRLWSGKLLHRASKIHIPKLEVQAISQRFYLVYSLDIHYFAKNVKGFGNFSIFFSNSPIQEQTCKEKKFS